MTTLPPEDPRAFLRPGTVVRYDGLDSGPEFGVVVHCWMSEQIHAWDCYVAFFGDTLPVGEPKERPYVLRYAATSLVALEDGRDG
ncbi:MAG: hypothetical protein AAF698_06685 [Pseudomonadota bacterium]